MQSKVCFLVAVVHPAASQFESAIPCRTDILSKRHDCRLVVPATPLGLQPMATYEYSAPSAMGEVGWRPLTSTLLQQAVTEAVRRRLFILAGLDPSTLAVDGRVPRMSSTAGDDVTVQCGTIVVRLAPPPADFIAREELDPWDASSYIAEVQP